MKSNGCLEICTLVFKESDEILHNLLYGADNLRPILLKPS